MNSKIEQLKQSVEMKVWDDGDSSKCTRTIVHIASNDLAIDTNREVWDHYETIPEPTYRAYTKDDDVSELQKLVGMITINKEFTSSVGMIVGMYFDELESDYVIKFNVAKVNLDFLFSNFTQLDGTPIGVLEL